MASPILKTYDIVAVECMNAKVFQFICEQGDAVDLITFDVANRIPFQLKKPWMDAAAKRGLYFELTYAACLGDSAGRRYFFSNAANLVRLTNGRHLVLSSGSNRDLFLRSPYDVVNVGILIGLTYGQAMDALTNAPLAVLDHAKTRRGEDGVGMLSEVMET
jgi:ribonuclease P/MRP protein subunit RPP1